MIALLFEKCPLCGSFDVRDERDQGFLGYIWNDCTKCGLECSVFHDGRIEVHGAVEWGMLFSREEFWRRIKLRSFE